MIEERGMFPSPKQRQCTSDLKRGPIERTIRGLGAKLVVNCMGMRADESPGRAKLQRLKLSARNSKAGREWYDWLPIHGLTAAEVFAKIATAGQQPHPIYAAGMSRFSCCFCIMASRADLTTAARLNPTLYRRYVELERSTGQVMLMPSKAHGRQTLEQVTGVAAC
jgi:3'-phosphoadenosine 5'-phosphosulfate sulfotransferase (PAPS reductase)/FAD synthetase